MQWPDLFLTFTCNPKSQSITENLPTGISAENRPNLVARVLNLSVDQAICDNKEEQQNYLLEFINSLTSSGMPEHWLCIEVGSIIVLLRNLDIQGGVCNGKRLTVKLLYENIIVAKTLTVNKKIILIP